MPTAVGFLLFKCNWQRLRIPGISALKPLDLVALSLGLIITALIVVTALEKKQQAELVEIYSPSGTWLFSLSKNKVWREEPDGNCEVAIQDGSVRVVRSECPQRICIKTGSISSASQWIACLPHKVFIRIRGDDSESLDAVSF